ncbi:DUF805 domain-containing protein [Frigidibacter sp. SD6-1]|uniref:DUF805 domain-containing protein n=1 Tax=Frigidibacter sp. SD6-1 TaxID=3032581 RepID=UPI0024DFCA0D|nr:DUF805 domain-containing protein [Frigidibacter sp. SD6-1]
MGPFEAIITCLRKSFRFSGRTSRSEFWWFASLAITACLILYITTGQTTFATDPTARQTDNLAFWPLALLALPLAAAMIRRVKDAGASVLFFWLPPLALLLSAGFFVISGGPAANPPPFGLPELVKPIAGFFVVFVCPIAFLVSALILLIVLIAPSNHIHEPKSEKV